VQPQIWSVHHQRKLPVKIVELAQQLLLEQ
jgi:hypothetical protein